MSRRFRVLACGSFHGGDDAAALEAVRLLPASLHERVSVEEIGQLSAEQLLDDGSDVVRIVLDCVHGVAPGEIVDLPLAEVPALARRIGVASSHALGIGQVVALAAAFGGIRPVDRFLGVGGASYAQGASLSPPVAEGVVRVAARIEQQVG